MGTGSKNYAVTGMASTVFELTISTKLVSIGEDPMPTRSRSSITTEVRSP
jgi:hypothetical protein